MKYSIIIILFLLLANELICAQTVFLQEPPEFKPAFEVAAVYLMHSGKILFLKRYAANEWGQLWGLPAGKLDEGETPYDAIFRETFEETGLDISDLAPTILKKLYVRDAKYDYNG